MILLSLLIIFYVIAICWDINKIIHFINYRFNSKNEIKFKSSSILFYLEKTYIYFSFYVRLGLQQNMWDTLSATQKKKKKPLILVKSLTNGRTGIPDNQQEYSWYGLKHNTLSTAGIRLIGFYSSTTNSTTVVYTFVIRKSVYFYLISLYNFTMINGF